MFTMGSLFEDCPGAHTVSPEQLGKECQSKDTTVDNFNNFYFGATDFYASPYRLLIASVSRWFLGSGLQYKSNLHYLLIQL